MFPLALLNASSPQNYSLELRFESTPIIDSTGRHSLTYPSGVTVSGGVGLFNGNSDSYITVNNNQNDWVWGVGDFTVSGVFTVSDLSAYRTFWDTNDNTNYASFNNFSLFVGTDGSLNIYTNGSTVVSTDPSAILLNTPYLVSVYRREGICYISVDGLVLKSFAFSSDLNNPNRKMYIGGSVFSSAQLSGTIDSFIAY